MKIDPLTKMLANDSSFWQHKLFVDVLTLFLELCRQSGVEWLK